MAKHRSTARTAKLVSNLILLPAYFLFGAGIIILAMSIAADVPANLPIEQIIESPQKLDFLLKVDGERAVKLIGLSILLGWMGYTLRTLASLLESQLSEG